MMKPRCRSTAWKVRMIDSCPPCRLADEVKIEESRRFSERTPDGTGQCVRADLSFMPRVAPSSKPKKTPTADRSHEFHPPRIERTRPGPQRE